MSDGTTYSLRNQDAAIFINFVRPDLLRAIRRTHQRRCDFEFADPVATCELNAAFHTGAGVDDAKALLASAKIIRDIVYFAKNDPDGVWERGTANE